MAPFRGSFWVCPSNSGVPVGNFRLGGLLNVLSGCSGRDLNLEVHPGVSFKTLKVGLSVWRSYSEISITWQWKADPVS